MSAAEMSIGELADAAGVSRRAVRFYVQQGLIPPPLGRGRGRHYDASHLQQLRRIGELQSAGHSLGAVRQILAGRSASGSAVPAPHKPARPSTRPAFSAELWTRLRLMEGVELQFDAARFNPPVERLLALREAVRAAFQEHEDEADPKGDREPDDDSE
jgi:DNA-binding transcriptional MerR regulator